MARARKNRRAVKAVKRKATTRHVAAKHQADKHVGAKVHNRTVNAPKAW